MNFLYVNSANSTAAIPGLMFVNMRHHTFPKARYRRNQHRPVEMQAAVDSDLSKRLFLMLPNWPIGKQHKPGHELLFSIGSWIVNEAGAEPTIKSLTNSIMHLCDYSRRCPTQRMKHEIHVIGPPAIAHPFKHPIRKALYPAVYI